MSPQSGAALPSIEGAGNTVRGTVPVLVEEGDRHPAVVRAPRWAGERRDVRRGERAGGVNNQRWLDFFAIGFPIRRFS